MTQLKLNFCNHRIADLFENHTFCLDCGDHWYKGKHYNKQQWKEYLQQNEKRAKELEAARNKKND